MGAPDWDWGCRLRSRVYRKARFNLTGRVSMQPTCLLYSTARIYAYSNRSRGFREHPRCSFKGLFNGFISEIAVAINVKGRCSLRFYHKGMM